MGLLDNASVFKGVPDPQPTLGDDFSTGLRAGTSSAAGQLKTLVGTGAQALGLSGALDGQVAIDAGMRDAQEAQQIGSGLTTLDGVHDLRSALRYGAGTAGQILPVAGAAIGAALATDGTAIPAMLAGTAATAPFEIGGQLQRQSEDPANAQRTAAERLAVAAPTGLGAAALQNIVPAGIAGRFAGKAGAPSLGRVAARSLSDVPVNALASGGAEGVRQLGDMALNPNAGFNQDAILEATKEGAGAGAVFGAAGAGAHFVGGGAKGVADAAKSKAGDLGSKIKAAGTEALTATQKASQEAAGAAKTGLQGFYDRIGTAKDVETDAFDKVAQGKPLGDDPAFASTPADSPAYKTLLEKLDNEHIAKATEWGKGLIDSASSFMTPERKAQVSEAMGDLGDAANRAKIATMAKAADLAGSAKTGVDTLGTAMSGWTDKLKASSGDMVDKAKGLFGKKKSEDFSGIRKTISDEMLPMIEKHNPGLLDDTEAVGALAEHVRTAVGLMQNGEALPKPVRNALYDAIGPKTGLLLDRVAKLSAAPEARDTFYKHLNDAEAARKQEDDLHTTMSKLLKPELQDSVKTSEIRQDARDLVAWSKRGETGTAEDKFRAQRVKEYLNERYGDKADKVLEAVDKASKKESAELDAKQPEGRDGAQHVDAEGEALPVTETRTDGTDALTKEQAAALKWESGKGSDDRRTSARAIKTEKAGVFDAVKITAGERLNHYERPGLERDAHAFADGLAKLQEHTGEAIKPADSTVINERGTTWGEAKKFLTQDRGPSVEDAKLAKLRDNYREARATNDVQRMDELGRQAQKLLDARDKAMIQEDFDSSHAQRSLEESGKQSADPLNDPIQHAAATMSPKELQASEDYSGQSLAKSTKASREGMMGALDSKIERLEQMTTTDGKSVNRTARSLAEKARMLQPVFEEMGPFDQAAFLGIVKARRISEMADTINALHNKYVKNAAPEVAAKESPKPQSPASRLEQRARSGDSKLLDEISKHEDTGQLQRALDHLNGLKDQDEGTKAAADAAAKRLSELVTQDPDKAYNLQRTDAQKPSAQQVGSGRANTAANTKALGEYLDRVLGPGIKRAWAKISHAGEFDAATETIRVSVHALDPLSTAHHEALHAFFKKLGDRGDSDIIRTVLKAADSPVVMRQLEARLKGEPEALKQLGNAEERAAYMYQFWAADPKGFKAGPQTGGVLSKLRDFFMKVLGTWSNDQRAVHIMEHFHQGDFAKDPSAFAKSMNEAGRNKAIERFKSVIRPMADISDSLTGAGAARLRDTGIPALRELADAMKLHGTHEGEDAGFIQSARIERTRMMNGIVDKLGGMDQKHLDDAVQALQTKTQASTPEGRLAQREIRKALDDTYRYMKQAGVKVNDLGLGKDYFPRVYDLDYISRHRQDFQTVLEKNGVPTKRAQEITNGLMASDGNQFRVETMKPGMQHLKERVLKDIPDAELERFMQKNLYATMNSYMTQAARRAEWARRMGDDGARVNELLSSAKAQGASKRDIETAERFVRGVDGTLGDHMSPELRRLQGNMLVYQNIRLLPLAIFSSIIDPLGVSVRGGTVRESWDTFKRGMKEIKHNFSKEAASDDATRLAESLGTIDNSMLVHTLGASYSQGMVGDLGRKINDKFFRYNLMEQFNQSMRVGATQAALGFLKRHADGTSSMHSERWLAELGLKKGDVQFDANGDVKVFQHQGLSADQETQMRTAVNRWVDGAVLRPDAADKPIWMNDPHFALFSHLKQFVYSFHETILKRVTHELEHGNMGPAYALASYVPIMIAADAVKGLIQGGGSVPQWKEDWGPEDYLWSGMERAGLFGTGQFGIDMLADLRRGGTGVGAVSGPTMEQLGDAVKTLGGREAFGKFALKSMPANALYASSLGGEATDPKFVD